MHKPVIYGEKVIFVMKMGSEWTQVSTDRAAGERVRGIYVKWV